MPTINTLQDLNRALLENPEWRAEVRRTLLTEELLELPQRFAEYTTSTDRRIDELTQNMIVLTQRVDALTQRMDELTERVDALTQRMDELTERVDALTQRMDELTERVDALTQRMDELTERVDALTQRMDELTQRFSDHVDATNKRFDDLDRKIETLTEQAIATNRRLDRLETRQDKMWGDWIEAKLPQKMPSIVSRAFDVRRPYTVLSARYGAASFRGRQFEEEVSKAADSGVITDDDETRLLVTDLIVRSQRKSDKSTLWFAVEASGVINRDDVERARQSADAIQKVYSQDAIPLVYGYDIRDEERELAMKTTVQVFLDPEG